jgi:hypothetical protein
MDEYIELLEHQPIEKINEVCIHEVSLGFLQGMILGTIITLLIWMYYNNQIRR